MTLLRPLRRPTRSPLDLEPRRFRNRREVLSLSARRPELSRACSLSEPAHPYREASRRTTVQAPTDRSSRPGVAMFAALIAALAIGFGTIGAALAADDALPRRIDRKTGEALPYERIAGRVVEYGAAVSARGHRVRTVTTHPENATGRLPLVVFVSWLSCDSIESPRGPADGWARMLHAVASSIEAVFVRVDKPGVGDSEGDCASTTLEDDLAAYRAAIRAAL